MPSANRFYWIAQFFGWSAYAALIVLAAYAQGAEQLNKDLIFSLALLVFFAILGTHFMRYFFIRLNWLALKAGPLVPRVLIASLLCAIFIASGTTLITKASEGKQVLEIPLLETVINILATLVLILFWNAIYFTYHFFQKSRKQELSNISLEASKNEIELKNLRAQLNPHFLFNSLNSIRALIELEPSKAKDAVTTLSSLLRSSLLMGKESLVELQEELEMVKNYLDLEKIRFEERLTVNWDLDPTLNSFKVPPFILQMLAENAIKHGISNLIHGGTIEIKTHKVGEEVHIQVSNSGKLGSSTDTGIGLMNTKRRLDLQFKGLVEFSLCQEQDMVSAKLVFKHIEV
jgi:two-component system, LytTR family, sensor kinase